MSIATLCQFEKMMFNRRNAAKSKLSFCYVVNCQMQFLRLYICFKKEKLLHLHIVTSTKWDGLRTMAQPMRIRNLDIEAAKKLDINIFTLF